MQRIKRGLFVFANIFLLFFLITSHAADPVIGKRTIKFINQCPFPVWFGLISGATPSRGGNVPCVTDADCYSGSVCVDRGAASKHCFWKNPIPTNGQFRLAPNGGSNMVDLPVYQDILASSWSGAATGRTNCTTTGCETGDCGGKDGGCPPGRGFMQPTTLAEFTFNKSGSDFYDISIVNGMNIPTVMSPTLDFIKPVKNCDGCGNPYNCGSPGATVPNTQVGKCTWAMTPPSNDYKRVAKGGPACTSDATCGGLTCGLSYDPTKTPKLLKTCGKLLGYWVANEACGKERNYGAPFYCTKPLPAPDQGLTMFNLYGCAPIESCYKTGAKPNCCGCANWDKLGIDVPPAPVTKQCDNINSFWVANVLPTLQWVKKACPTVYTYPFDDMSSTFVCKVMRDNKNVVNYKITFCPDGKTGGVPG